MPSRGVICAIAYAECYILLWLIACGLLPVAVSGAQQATASLHSLSLLFHAASVRDLGVNYTLKLTTGTPPNDVNGELAPLLSGGSRTHGAYFVLQADIFPEPLTGSLYLDVPPFSDSNSNGLADFFELSQPATGATSGAFTDDLTGENGTITATWNRAAGATLGTCQMHLQSSYLNETFNHVFDLLEYDGTLSYTPASQTVTAVLSLSDAAAATNTLGGQILFTNITSDSLMVAAGSVTNVAGQAWPYQAISTNSTIDRLGTNYVGFLAFTNGGPDSVAPSFFVWALLLGDANDANGDGIPDLTDPVALRAPSLALTKAQGSFWLILTGDLGRAYDVQQLADLTQTNWTNVLTLTLTNTPQLIALPPPTGRQSFWRAKTP